MHILITRNLAGSEWIVWALHEDGGTLRDALEISIGLSREQAVSRAIIELESAAALLHAPEGTVTERLLSE